MALDGFTLIAQIVNFLILVYLLKRFLYRPILEAMDRREAIIAQKLADAEQLEQQARAERLRFEQETQHLAVKRQDLLNAAQADADERREQLFESARSEVEQAREQWFAELSREREQFLQTIRRELGVELCVLSKRALADMADAGLQDQIIRVFLRRLENLSDMERKTLLDEGHDLTIRAALDLTAEQQAQLTSGLGSILGEPLQIEFERQAELICGVVLATPSGELAWDMNHYVQDLADRLRDRVEYTVIRAEHETADRAR